MVTPVPTDRHRRIMAGDPHRRVTRLHLRVLARIMPHRVSALHLRITARLRLRTRRRMFRIIPGRDLTQRRARVSRLRTRPVEASPVHVLASREDVRGFPAGMAAAEASAAVGSPKAHAVKWTAAARRLLSEISVFVVIHSFKETTGC